MDIRSLKNRIDTVAAKVPSARPPSCLLLCNADGTCRTPEDEQRRRQVNAAGGTVIRVIPVPPREEAVPS